MKEPHFYNTFVTRHTHLMQNGMHFARIYDATYSNLH